MTPSGSTWATPVLPSRPRAASASVSTPSRRTPPPPQLPGCNRNLEARASLPCLERTRTAFSQLRARPGRLSRRLTAPRAGERDKWGATFGAPRGRARTLPSSFSFVALRGGAGSESTSAEAGIPAHLISPPPVVSGG